MSIAHKVSAWNRRRKWSLFLAEFCPNEKMRILDVGFAEKEYSQVDNFIEKHYPYPERLTALGIGTPKDVKSKYPKMSFIKYDGSVFPFKDKAFDICWSNAVIEHVGELGNQLFFLKEIKRVSKKAFITTPNKYFPVELHTRTPLLHYLPKSMFDGYLRLIGKEWATDAYMHLLSITDLKHLLRKADIENYTIAKNRFCGLTLDFVILIE